MDRILRYAAPMLWPIGGMAVPQAPCVAMACGFGDAGLGELARVSQSNAHYWK